MRELKINIFFIIVCILFITNCKKAGEVKKENDTISKVNKNLSEYKEVVNNRLSQNEKVVIKLKEMKKAFEKESKEEMLQFFGFPTKTFLFIRRNEEFREKIALSNNELTKETFLKYAKVKKSSSHPSLYQLLATLNLDSLNESNSIEKDLEINDDECYYMYKIEIKNNSVILSYGSNSNQKYSDEGDCSERHIFLYFKIINDKMIFEKSDAAG